MRQELLIKYGIIVYNEFQPVKNYVVKAESEDMAIAELKKEHLVERYIITEM